MASAQAAFSHTRRESQYSELGGSTTEDYVTPAEEIESEDNDDTPTPKNEHAAAGGFPFPQTQKSSQTATASTNSTSQAPAIPETTAVGRANTLTPRSTNPNIEVTPTHQAASSAVAANGVAVHDNGRQGSASKPGGSKFLDKIRQLTPSVPSHGTDKEWEDEDADAEESGKEDRVRRASTQRRRKAVKADSTYGTSKPQNTANSSEPKSATAPALPAAAALIASAQADGQVSNAEEGYNDRLELSASDPRASDSIVITEPISPRPIRRSTAPEVNNHLGLSEDEGRAKLSKTPGWRRQSSAWFHHHAHATQSPTAETSKDDSALVSKSRPRNLKRLSQIARGSGGPGSSSPTTPARTRTELGPRWRQVKAGLRLMGKRRPDKISLDQEKSTELMAELLAGSPAALILASRFQRDEHEKRKIPVLLEQLKVNVVDSRERNESSGDRHVNFRIELEYGNGLMRKKWVIWRRLGDFVTLHTKYKLEATSQKYRVARGGENSARSKLPRFPRSAFPYLRGVRGLADESDEDEEKPSTDRLLGESTSPVTAEDQSKGKKRSSMGSALRRRSTANMDDANQEAGVNSKDLYAERQRKKLEQYLREMIRYQMFRAGSNRLCKFLELSALGVRLASEGGYQGKEGMLVLQSGSGTDWRRAWNPVLLAKRHKPMWFLVRSSYIACVDSPEAMNIYDCFLVDPFFSMSSKRPRIRDQKGAKDKAKTATSTAAHPQHHSIKLYNSERRLKLLVKNSNLLQQWQESIDFMAKTSEWAKKHRFESFAPIRHNVYAQWLVDGRDYMWNVSRAISQARDVIYIHDWWLSPELYMRRPAAISQKWRLDRLLKQKAEEGVKIFVIMYRNIDAAIPIDSEYSKFSLLDLHPNIFVQRSPNQVRQNVFFWSHHEKICVIDHSIAFCGGVDLCFGRWDTPSHSVIDDKPTGFEPTEGPKDADHCQLWPGKDYSNPRVLDFFKLDDPYGEMYDRSRVPRMPWHDIGMQILGQPARDLTRHFVQRWNYVLRQRTPTRPTPFLLPPSDFTDADLQAMGIDGTCTIQMLRSCGEWSMGTPGKTEHSIQNAYVKLIEESLHFVYLENQFFITSCMVEGTKVHNKIGDALVERIIRAHENGERWLAVLVIPLMPGYANAVDDQDGTSVRLIMQCQFRSICRGNTSIFERLRNHGIVPEDYIRFYSLRSWGKIGPTKALITEQLYIHAKCMVVDDRWALIGSANINERSLLGNRDSEVAALVWDNDMIESRMADKDFKVGRFPHTLRMRLMREHLGIDVDDIMDEERAEQYDQEAADEYDAAANGDAKSVHSQGSGERKAMESRHRLQDALIARSDEVHAFNHDADWEQANNPRILRHKKVTTDARVTGNKRHEDDVEGRGFDNMAAPDQQATLQGRDSKIIKGNREVLVESISPEGKGSLASPARKHSTRKDDMSGEDADDALSAAAPLPPWPTTRMSTHQLGLPTLSLVPTLPNTDDTALGGPPLQQEGSEAPGSSSSNPLLATLRRPMVDKDCMRDPLNQSFYDGTWDTVAKNNTKLFRNVFRCQPDNEVRIWSEYHEWNLYAKRFKAAQGMSQDDHEVKGQKAKTGPPGTGASKVTDGLAAITVKSQSAEEAARRARPATMETTDSAETEKVNGNGVLDEKKASQEGADTVAGSQSAATSDKPSSKQQQRRRRATTRSRAGFSANEPIMPKGEAEDLMKMVQGHLVEWPYDWLAQEERGGKWLYTVDQMAPIEIYN